MANTYIQIGSTVTVGAGGAATIDFSSIPATFTDLKLVASLRLVDNIDYGTIKFNNASTTFSSVRLDGDGSTITSSSRSDNLIFGYEPSGQTANTFNNLELYISNYTASINKCFSIDVNYENNSASALVEFFAGLWSTTSTINQITIAPNSGNFVQYSTATLYGI